MSSMASCPTSINAFATAPVTASPYASTPSSTKSGPATPGLVCSQVSGYFNDDVNTTRQIFTKERTVFVSGLNASDIGTITNGRFMKNNPNTLYYSIAFVGYFVAPRTGDYTFYLQSDDSAYVWLDRASQRSLITDFGTAIIKNPGIHGDDKVITSGAIRMEEGEMRPFTMLYGQGFGGSNLRLAWSGPGQAITNDFSGVWYYDPRDLDAPFR